MALKLHWHGHSAWTLESDGVRLLIDPFLTGNPEQIKTFTSGATEFALTSDEKHIALVVHGDIFLMPRSGNGSVLLRGSSVYKQSDGKYSVDGERPNSMPTIPLTRAIGRG